jgi:hypothetical protein
MFGLVIQKIEIEGKVVTIHTALPAQGYTKARLLEAFAEELDRAARDGMADGALGGTIRINGRMTVEMAMAAGAAAARLGAKRAELFDPASGEYVPVLGEGAPLAIPVSVLPSMEVEIVGGGGLFRPGARAEVLNVGRDSVNVAQKRDGSRRGRRDTGWIALENVRPVGWTEAPRLRG